MDFPILFFLLLYTLQYSDGNSSLIEPKCSDASGKVRCCAGYRTISEMCQECIGSFGFECSRNCHEGFYGKQCNERCQCKLCNFTSGECVKETTDASNDTRDATEFGVSPFLAVLLGLCGSIGSLAAVIILLYIRERRKKTKDDIIHCATPFEENPLEMCELDDYDNIRESCMVGTGVKQVVDRVSYARTETIPNAYNKLSFNRRKSHAVSYKSDNVYNMTGDSTSQTEHQSSGDYVTVASNHKSPNGSDLEHTLKRNTNARFENSDDNYANIHNGGSKEMPAVNEEAEKTAPQQVPPRGKHRHKKPKIAPKPVNNKCTTDNREGRPYSLANTLE